MPLRDAFDAPLVWLRRQAGLAPERVAHDIVQSGGMDRGTVTTTRYAARLSPSGFSYQVIARYPKGQLAERVWTQYDVEARAAHDAMIERQKARLVPEEE